MDAVTNIVFFSLFVSHTQRREEPGVATPLHLHAKREADFKVSFLKEHCISFHPHIPSPPVISTPVLSLPLARRGRKQTERKERNMLPGLEKSSFPRSSVIMLMEGRTGKRKCFANVENFWPGFFLRPVCQGEKEIGGWMKYELMQLQCL